MMQTRVSFSFFAVVLLLLIIAGTAAGQESAQQDPQQEKPKDKGDVSPKGAQSLLEDIINNPRHRLGFAIGAFEVYQDNLYQTGQNAQAAASAALTGRFYANLGRRKSRFHVDYGAAYQFYNNKRGLNAPTMYGTSSYSNQLSRRTSLSVQDTFSSSLYGHAYILSSILGGTGSLPEFSTQLLTGRQRIVQNNLTSILAYGAGRHTFSVFGGYNLYRFGSTNQQDLDGFLAGASYGLRITNWLFLNNGYSGYLNKVDKAFQNTRIHQLQVGGLSFKLARKWQASIAGGVQLANSYGKDLWTEDVSASLIWRSPSNMFAIRYHRGFYTTVGITGLLQSDQASLAFGSRLTNRLNLQVAGTYLRGANFYDQGTRTQGDIDYYSAMGGLQFSLFQGLIASTNIVYRKQRSGFIPGLSASLDSLTAFAGLQYAFPSGIR